MWKAHHNHYHTGHPRVTTDMPARGLMLLAAVTPDPIEKPYSLNAMCYFSFVLPVAFVFLNAIQTFTMDLLGKWWTVTE